MSEKITKAIVELKPDELTASVKNRIDNGADPVQILDECREGMRIVGELFQKGEYFLAEMMLAAEIFKKAVDILEPYLNKSKLSDGSLGKVVLATLKGDTHDLGKNILSTLLKAQGFEVYDLGVDVDPKLLIEKVKAVNPDLVGFSALITTVFASMKEAAEMLEKEGLRNQIKLMIGGGVTSAILKDHIDADFQTLDATEGVEYCLNAVGANQNE